MAKQKTLADLKSGQCFRLEGGEVVFRKFPRAKAKECGFLAFCLNDGSFMFPFKEGGRRWTVFPVEITVSKPDPLLKRLLRIKNPTKRRILMLYAGCTGPLGLRFRTSDIAKLTGLPQFKICDILQDGGLLSSSDTID